MSDHISCRQLSELLLVKNSVKILVSTVFEHARITELIEVVRSAQVAARF